MGNQVSLESFDPAHIRIYKNILSNRSVIWHDIEIIESQTRQVETKQPEEKVTYTASYKVNTSDNIQLLKKNTNNLIYFDLKRENNNEIEGYDFLYCE